MNNTLPLDKLIHLLTAMGAWHSQLPRSPSTHHPTEAIPVATPRRGRTLS